MENNNEYKGYAVVSDGTFGHKLIKPLGKGSVHLSLRGSYTNAGQAFRAIDVYLSQKDNTNGKTE